jgi:hypothetical protein
MQPGIRLSEKYGYELVAVSNDFPRLRDYAKEQERLRDLIANCEKRIGQLDQDNRRILDQLSSATSMTDQKLLAERREALKAESDRLYAEKEAAERQIEQQGDQCRQWQEKIALELYTRKRLVQEMARALPDDMNVMQLGTDGPARTKARVEEDLISCLFRLANLTGDKKLASEAKKMEMEFLNRQPWVVLSRDYVRLSSGEIVTQSEQQRRALAGDESVNRGTTSGPYRRGSRVDRQEAIELGLEYFKGE